MNLLKVRSISLATLLAVSAFLSACASNNIDFDNDPDLFTSSEDIPERPGLLEIATGKKAEIGF